MQLPHYLYVRVWVDVFVYIYANVRASVVKREKGQS